LASAWRPQRWAFLASAGIAGELLDVLEMRKSGAVDAFREEEAAAA